jgi:hypothetical protein
LKYFTDAGIPLIDDALQTEVDIKIGLQKLLASHVEGLMNDQKRKGCFMANSCSLVNTENNGIEQKIFMYYHRIEQFLTFSMEKARILTTKAKTVSAMIITFLIGMSQQSKINRDKASYLDTVNSIVGLLD